jgi:hypothetical protein
MLNATLRELKTYWIVEETKARQRSRDKNILKEDRNTTYFHTVANQRRRKNIFMFWMALMALKLKQRVC